MSSDPSGPIFPDFISSNTILCFKMYRSHGFHLDCKTGKSILQLGKSEGFYKKYWKKSGNFDGGKFEKNTVSQKK